MCNEFLTLRNAPSAGADEINQLLPGSKIEIINFFGRFAHVKADNQKGYVLSMISDDLGLVI